jgi:hypothetical protein
MKFVLKYLLPQKKKFKKLSKVVKKFTKSCSEVVKMLSKKLSKNCQKKDKMLSKNFITPGPFFLKAIVQ